MIFKRWLQRMLYFLTNSTKPVSDTYGFDRGKPVDRYFIEQFIEKNKKHIRGICLEIGNNDYTTRFGGRNVHRIDILDIDTTNKQANIYADLKNLNAISSSTYDCIILTQVLQCIDDVGQAIKECYRILKKNGVLLVTVPSLSRTESAFVSNQDNWRFTTNGARYIFTKIFRDAHVEVTGWGNALLGSNFWLGFSVEDTPKRAFDIYDPNFICGVCIMAVKT